MVSHPQEECPVWEMSLYTLALKHLHRGNFRYCVFRLDLYKIIGMIWSVYGHNFQKSLTQYNRKQAMAEQGPTRSLSSEFNLI